MELHNRSKLTTEKSKRVGRGYGSGKAKTSGRGTKGRKARGKVPLYFEGGALPLIKRLPYLKGKGRNKVFKIKPLELDLDELNVFRKDAVVDMKALIKQEIITEKEARYGVKILNTGKLEKQITLKVPATKGAKKAIEKAGGKVEEK